MRPFGRLAGILTVGGTVLGTSRDKPHRMEIDGRVRDMTGVIAANYRRLRLDALVCIGGGGTQKSALRLVEQGLHIITLPKTIDNDVAMTDATIGFDTALGIATEALDRLHSTAHSHHRIVIAEIMGHRAGWLTLGAGIAGGADVILIPEIPYDVEKIVAAVRRRSRSDTNFSIVAVAEGAMSKHDAVGFAAAERHRRNARTELEKEHVRVELAALEARHTGNTIRLSKQLEELTRLEARVTILGYVQRGGTPSVADRLLATRLGTACAGFINEGVFGVMVAARGDGVKVVPIEEVAGKLKAVPPGHPWIKAARRVGTCLGD
jgi:6-phosphofructokinase 1